MKKNPTQKSFKKNKKLVARATRTSKLFCIWGIAPKLEIGIL
jgi:hypothetical protein